MPGARPTTLASSPLLLTGPSPDGTPFALSLRQVPSVLPSPQVPSFPLGHACGRGGYLFPVVFFPVGLTPKY